MNHHLKQKLVVAVVRHEMSMPKKVVVAEVEDWLAMMVLHPKPQQDFD